MSLSQFIKRPEVRARFASLRPRLSRKITEPLKVEPRSTRYMTVGTAFDYLLRFELQRRAPHAISRQWVAEHALDFIWDQRGDGSEFGLPLDDEIVEALRNGTFTPKESNSGVGLAREVAGRARKVLDDAKAAHAAYMMSKSPTREEQTNLAAHAIRLAKLEEVPRAFRLDPSFEEAASEDVEDLLAMLAIVPFDSLLHDQVLHLNPTFKESSRLVGGSDADLITGDTLLDFKTTKASEVTAAFLDQLLGFFLLARNQHRIDPMFPKIRRLALYFCRHGYVWVQDAALWTDHPEFPELERWFFEVARKATIRLLSAR